MVICFMLGITLVAIAILGVTLANMQGAPRWVYVIAFFLPFCAEYVWQKIKEYAPFKEWYKSWKRLKSTGKYDRIRISFSYLFRIKTGDKYLLVKNEHGTDLFQPVGGVYKYDNAARAKLKKLGAIEDSGTVIKADSTTKRDFRLRVEIAKLPKFVRWFQKGKQRETVCNLNREFSEELIESGILTKKSFKQIKYTYIGQHVSDICSAKYDRNVYELFIADIVEVNLSEDQYSEVENLQFQASDQYCFATENMILSNKTRSGPDNNKIDIADHSFKILETIEPELEKRKIRKYVVDVK